MQEVEKEDAGNFGGRVGWDVLSQWSRTIRQPFNFKLTPFTMKAAFGTSKPSQELNFREKPLPLKRVGLPCIGGIKRDKLNGTNGFLRKSAFPAKICSLRLRNAVIPRKSEYLQKSAKIYEKLRLGSACPF